MSRWHEENEQNIMIVGHRGIRDFYPENTMISFQAALDLKLDLIEFDVHFTKDKYLVVCHDADIKRTTNGEGLIREMTLEELQSYDAGIKKDKKFAGQKIPTLYQVLKLLAEAPYEVLLNVEIKDYDHEVVDQTIQMLKQFDLGKRSVIACFNAEIIDYTQTAHPYMKTQGFPERYMRPSTPSDYPITENMYKQMYGIGIPIIEDDINGDMTKDVAMAKQYGIKPWLFCADNEKRTILAVEAGATNITCNNPYATMKYLREHGLRK